MDGDVPPSQGTAFPVRPALHDFIKGLIEPDGMLPIWSRWFARDMQRMSLVGVDILARDAVAFAANLVVMLSFRRTLGDATFAPHLIGVCVYTAIAFAGSHYFAFRER